MEEEDICLNSQTVFPTKCLWPPEQWTTDLCGSGLISTKLTVMVTQEHVQMAERSVKRPYEVRAEQTLHTAAKQSNKFH
jgi:hypothetical protein